MKPGRSTTSDQEIPSPTVQSGQAAVGATQTTAPNPPASDNGSASIPGAQQQSVDLFLRPVNGNAVVKSITFKKLLTRPLVAMAHKRELLFECTSEMYEHTLPTAGRTDKPSAATLIDGIDLETGEEVSLILNTVMKSAFERAKPPLSGRAFGLRAGEAKADKRYRIVDVIEVEVQR